MFPVSCDLLPCDVMLWCCHTILSCCFVMWCDVLCCCDVMCFIIFVCIINALLPNVVMCWFVMCCAVLPCIVMWCEALWWVVQCFYYPVMWCIVLYCPVIVLWCDVVCGFSSSFIPNLMLLTTIHKHISFTCSMSSWNLLIQYIISRFQVKNQQNKTYQNTLEIANAFIKNIIFCYAFAVLLLIRYAINHFLFLCCVSHAPCILGSYSLYSVNIIITRYMVCFRVPRYYYLIPSL